jgi:hypothetical protein
MRGAALALEAGRAVPAERCKRYGLRPNTATPLGVPT